MIRGFFFYDLMFITWYLSFFLYTPSQPPPDRGGDYFFLVLIFNLSTTSSLPSQGRCRRQRGTEGEKNYKGVFFPYL
jgi:hypothetical protein